MLTDIYIKNYTIVDQLELSLNSGLSMLSGETGAGKSIIVDAVSLALGRRGDNKVIRQHQTQCEITLCFNIDLVPEALTWLAEHDFNDENECIISRTLTNDGRSRSTINGKPCPLNLVRQLANKLLIIHGQHQSQTLTQQEQQQSYVDHFGKHETLLIELQEIYSTWRSNEKELTQLKAQSLQRNEQLGFFKYQLEELETLNLAENEWQKLHHEHQKLHHAKELISNLDQALELTINDERANASLLIQQAIDQLKSVNIHEAQLDSITKMLNTAAIHVQEAGDELSHYRASLDLSPEKLALTEQRLTLIHDLARKHHVNPEDLEQIQKSLNQKIYQLESNEELIEALTAKQQSLICAFHKIATSLSEKRQKVAKQINRKMTTYLQELGMQGGEFNVLLESLDEKISAHGLEKISFLVKTNPGQTLAPLAKIVSGGELSRISLALQAIIAEKENTPTFIFDEVDTGIGGKTAEIVGKLLHTLSAKSQVFCITHLSQVAAQGDHHYKVKKSSTKNSTTTEIAKLSKKERVTELARMISGAKITKQTLSHAEGLLT